MSHTSQTRKGSTARAALVALTVVLLLGSTAGANAADPPSTDFEARGSVEQVYVTGFAAGQEASLIAPDGSTVETRTANSNGGMLFRKVAPGDGYVVESAGVTSAPVTVHDQTPAPWNPEIYQQEIPSSGYGYLTTRDGTQLAYTVHPPTSPAGLAGLPHGTQVPEGPTDWLPPYPTLIEYSGYGYARPSGPQSGIAALANLMGFAVVDVNMRGTGCSGGAYDFFEPLQNLDGYDIIETVANQPWVKGNKVGMLGISYGGISQLFTAQLKPPHLAAITPISVIDATPTTLYPGGILNTGFAVAWSQERENEARPAPDGQGWATERIANGDTVCAENQVLHGEAADLTQAIADNDHYIPEIVDPLDPVTFVDDIEVPVFMACQWQDEQTGGHCPELAKRFKGTDKKWFTFTNGPHIDSLSPEVYNHWYDFLMLYVAKTAPIQNQAITRAVAPLIFQATMGVPQDNIHTLPVDPIQLMPTYEMALEAFEQLPRVRILFENGAGTSPTGQFTPGNAYPAFERGFDSWPIKGTSARTWNLGPDGTLTDALPVSETIATYTSDASALSLTNYDGNTGGGGLWGLASQWDWDWEQNPEKMAVSYVTEPLTADTTVIGGGSVELWVRSSTPDVDLQVTISEVRPDGNETFVQNGYLRASKRKLSTDSDNIFKRPSTTLYPVPSYLESDAEPMPTDAFARLVVPLYYQGHVYRAGSSIRVTIAAPNGQQPVWSFSQTEPAGENATSEVSISSSPTRPSRLTLPVIPGLGAPTPLPPCPSLRNQPCRTYVPFDNG